MVKEASGPTALHRRRTANIPGDKKSTITDTLVYASQTIQMFRHLFRHNKKLNDKKNFGETR